MTQTTQTHKGFTLRKEGDMIRAWAKDETARAAYEKMSGERLQGPHYYVGEFDCSIKDLKADIDSFC